jgi:hypothetical protein
MAKVEKEDMFCCADCGLEVVVNKACGCVDTELICCGGPMIKEKSAPGGTKSKASAKTPAKAAAGKSKKS